MDVIVLGSNQPPERFYRGGPKIAAFRHEPPAGDREPEDWVGSTTALAGEDTLGVTVLPGGRSLPAAIAADAEAWLGRPHLDRFGADTRLLVKLLDAGQRLPVHAHPHAWFAGRHLGRAHGKAEAWYIVDGGEIYLGLRRDVTAAELEALVRDQDIDSLLGLLHRIEVRPGDVVYVPPGVLHAIGAGVFVVEVQEPEDLSILLEWRDFDLDGARDGHLGLGFGVALEAVERRGRGDEEIRELIRPAGFGASVLPAAADPYFVLERVALDGQAAIAAGFAVLVVLTGEAETPAGLRLGAGSTVLIPYAASPLSLRGQAELLLCRPPAA
jgi:mannose-6-phosphate isomerase